jgi:protein-disulfide isomerase
MTSRFAAVLLTLFTASTPCLADDASLFEYGGAAYGPGDLSIRMQQLYGSVLADHYQAMRTLVDEMVFDVYVEQQAAKLGRPAEEVGREMLATPEPDDDAVHAFYEQNRASMSQPFELLADQIRRYLRRQAMLTKRDAILSRIKAEGDFKLMLQPPPSAPVSIDTRGRPVRGNVSAPITLVEFSDFQCPNCKRAVKVMELLLQQHPDKVKLVHMDFPINPSGISRVVAHGGVCAQAQGRFWDYHDRAFQEQETLGHASPSALASALGLDMERFAACMNDPSTRRKVAASEAQAKTLGITATPTLFVDGRPFPSTHLLRDLGEYITAKTSPKPSS